MSLIDLEEGEERGPPEHTRSKPNKGPVSAKRQAHGVKDAGSESESEEFLSPLCTSRSKRGPQRVHSDNEEDGDTDFTPGAEPAPPRSKRQRTEAGRPSKVNTRLAAAQTEQRQGNSAAKAALGTPAPRRAGLRDKRPPAGLNVRELLIANQRRMLDGTPPDSAPASATSSGQGAQAEDTETDEESIIDQDASENDADYRCLAKLTCVVQKSQGNCCEFGSHQPSLSALCRALMIGLGIVRHGDPEEQFEKYVQFQVKCLLNPDRMDEVVQSDQTTMTYFTEVCRIVEDRLIQCRSAQLLRLRPSVQQIQHAVLSH